MKPGLAFAILTALLTASACNTVEGLGRDVSAGGRAIEDAAEKTERAINPPPTVYYTY